RNARAARAYVGDDVVREVAQDGTTEPAAALLLLERGAGRREEVARIQGFVAVKVVGAAVPIVRAGSRDRVEDHAGGIAELRLVLIGQDLELFDGVRRRVRADGVGGHHLRAHAVDERLTAAARLTARRHRLR